MAENVGAAQARTLLAALNYEVTDISGKLEAAEQRGRTSIRGAAHDRREAASLRRELYEVHRLIDGLHRRFPETIPPRRPLAAMNRVSTLRQR